MIIDDISYNISMTDTKNHINNTTVIFILFSYLQLSFGTAQTYLHQIMTGDRPVKAEGASGLGDEALLQFLQRLGDNFEITDMITVSIRPTLFLFNPWNDNHISVYFHRMHFILNFK